MWFEVNNSKSILQNLRDQDGLIFDLWKNVHLQFV